MSATNIFSSSILGTTACVKQLVDMCLKAGDIVLDIYNQKKYEVNFKEDGSPVTTADIACHNFIEQELTKLTGSLPILSEESTSVPYKERKNWKDFWLIDPVDGTREFVKRTGDFTINVAFITDNKPAFGVVYIPTKSTIYFGGPMFKKSWKQYKNEELILLKTISCDPANVLKVALSRNITEKKMPIFFAKIRSFFNKIDFIERAGAIKGCLVAEGLVDLYPRLGPTYEWDTAAFQALIEPAGGCVIDTTGKKLKYNTKESLLNPSFYALGDPNANWREWIQLNEFDINDN